MKHFEGENADIVVCDGAPDVTGIYIFRAKLHKTQKCRNTSLVPY